MSVPSPANLGQWLLTPAGRGLLWQNWEDAYIVYQPSSTETHVFNETTALILESLEQGPLPMESIKHGILEVLGLETDELANDSLMFAVGRLEALGLIDCLDGADAGS